RQMHQTPMERGDAAITGRLIEHRIAFRHRCEGFGIALLLDFERIESGTQHKYELVTQHLSCRAELATKLVAFTQQTRLGVGAAIPEQREYQCNDSEPAEMRQQLLDVTIVRPDHPGLSLTLKNSIGISQKTLSRNQNCAVCRNFRIICEMREFIGDDDV